MRQIILLACGLALLAPMVSAAGKWYTDQNGCQIWNPFPAYKETIRWSGSCVDGKGHGEGVLEYFKAGAPSSRRVLNGENGASMVEGREVVDIEGIAMSFELSHCDAMARYRAVDAFVTNQPNLVIGKVTRAILAEAGRFAQRECPVDPDHAASNISVQIFQAETLEAARQLEEESSGRSGLKWAVEARNYSHPEFTWGEYNNKVAKDAKRQLTAVYNKDVRERQASVRAREADRKRMEEERAVKARAKLLFEFTTKNGLYEIVSSRKLASNPFVYEGKTVGVMTTFQNMITADRALFDNVVMSGVPRTLFTRRVYVFIAGKVLGNTSVKNELGGEVLVPHLRFVDVHFCTQKRCTDILD